jgi:hypothetical protein
MLPVSEELSQPHQTARNLRRSLRNAAAGAWLIQAEGLDRKSAADLAASLADALEELHRLQRTLDRRIRCDRERFKQSGLGASENAPGSVSVGGVK